jgi:hypothetical protein
LTLGLAGSPTGCIVPRPHEAPTHGLLNSR